MSHKTLITLGIWIAFLPFLGFPTVIKNILFAITGAYIAFSGYRLYRKKEIEAIKNLRQTKTFAEVAPSVEGTTEADPITPETRA
jgi:hypothetical protein